MKKLLFLLSLVLLIADCACSKKIVLKGISVEIPSSIVGLSGPEDREKLSALIKRDINNSQYYEVNVNKTNSSILKLFFIPPKDSHDKAVLLAGSIADPKIEQKEYRAFADIKVEKGTSSGEAVTSALEKVLEQLYQQQNGYRTSHKDYLAKIEKGSKGEIGTGELIGAISAVSYAKDMNAVAPLISLLKTTEDVAVANAALLALGDLKAEEAMPAIIDFLEGKVSIIRRQGITAAKRIGSKLALEWLFVMAYGHEDPVVRKEALDAFTELETKRAQK